jgi:Acetyltransferase (GNAT) family
MHLSIFDKGKLTAAQADYLASRLLAPEHKLDHGPPSIWHIYDPSTLYAFTLLELGLPIAIAEASGPVHAANPGWWIDSQFRGKGYGNELVDLLADRLKTKGYTGVIERIAITSPQPDYAEASRKMVTRFRAHFPVQRRLYLQA